MVSIPTTRRRALRSPVPAALLVTLLASTAGCAGGSGSSAASGGGEAPAEPAICGLVSEETLRTLTGETKVTALGSMVSAEQRQLSGLKCQVADASTADLLVRINVVDADGEADARAQAALVSKEGRSVRDCVTREPLPNGGYLCAWADETVAAVAMPDRLIRVIASGDARDNLTAASAPGLFDEINGNVESYDQADES
jgi:hypothetical protein